MSRIELKRHVERIESPELLHYLDYDDDCAYVEVPGHRISAMPFEASVNMNSNSYLQAVERVRNTGHDNSSPIVLYPRSDGKWEVQDADAERFIAAKEVAGEFFSNLFEPKVRKVIFSLQGSSLDGSYKTPRFSSGGTE